jgi:hypothetical protein
VNDQEIADALAQLGVEQIIEFRASLDGMGRSFPEVPAIGAVFAALAVVGWDEPLRAVTDALLACAPPELQMLLSVLRRSICQPGPHEDLWRSIEGHAMRVQRGTIGSEGEHS